MSFNNVELRIINLASILLNDTALDTTDTNTPFAVKAGNALDFLYEPTIATSNWRFATVIEKADEIPESEGKPEFVEFSFKMRLPADMLAIHSIFNTGGTSESLIEYKMFSDNVIFTKVNEVSVEYRRSVDINKIPQYFIHYLGFVVANFLAIGFTKLRKAEQIEKMMVEANAKALYIERQNYPMAAIKSNPLAHNSLSTVNGFLHNFNLDI